MLFFSRSAVLHLHAACVQGSSAGRGRHTGAVVTPGLHDVCCGGDLSVLRNTHVPGLIIPADRRWRLRFSVNMHVWNCICAFLCIILVYSRARTKKEKRMITSDKTLLEQCNFLPRPGWLRVCTVVSSFDNLCEQADIQLHTFTVVLWKLRY